MKTLKNTKTNKEDKRVLLKMLQEMQGTNPTTVKYL